MKLRKKIKRQREILEIIWEDKSWTRRSWIRGVCKQCKDGIFGEEEIRELLPRTNMLEVWEKFSSSRNRFNVLFRLFWI